MILCPKCGQINDDTAIACRTCAQPVRSGPTSPVPRLASETIRSAAARSSEPLKVRCLVCGATVHKVARASECLDCHAPVGTTANPNDPTNSTFQMIPVSMLPLLSPSLTYAGANRYKEHSGSAEDPEYGNNWGAAFLTIFWSLRHKRSALAVLNALNLLFWTVIVLLTVSNRGALGNRSPVGISDWTEPEAILSGMIALSAVFWIGKTIFLVLRGNALAWKSGLYSSVDEMRSAQQKWARVGIPAFIASMIVLLTAFIYSISG